jgi:acetyltransferase-like isoleucine patch superfamily enzyme
MTPDIQLPTESGLERMEREVKTKAVLDHLFEPDSSAFKKYQAFFVGRPGVRALVAFELITTLAGPLPGALGFLLRKWLYPHLFQRVGSGALWGCNITLRHPWRIAVGHRVAIDDGCLLDARGAGDSGIRIGNDVLIARDTIIQAKGSWIEIGDRCTIGSQSQLSSVGGIRLGRSVMIGGQCYVGGGRHRTDDPARPIMDQGIVTKGPIVIEDDVWLGAGVIVQDGVRIGRGSVVGAGAVVQEDVLAFTMAVPHQRLVLLPRAGT